ncbi:MAG: prephenate dehydratase [Planctomycetota bacterium]
MTTLRTKKASVAAALRRLRERIDKLDRRIVNLLNRRAAVAVNIGAVKRRTGQAVYSPGRERQIYDRVVALNRGPLRAECVRAVYRELMSGSLALEKSLVIAYWGPPATYTHIAARRKFGDSVDYVPVSDIEGVFNEIARGRADHGVVPVENSTEGGVNRTLDLFAETDVKVCGEIYLPIRHCLLGRGRPEGVRRIFSHPNALGQCRRWLAHHYPEAEIREAANTTQAAELASRDPASAAIASDEAAKLYRLRILFRDLEDRTDNVTRFFILGRAFGGPTGRDKTSICFSIRDEVGGLYKTLVPFRRHGINMTRIESRPSRRRAWEYLFFVDFEGHAAESRVRRALAALGRRCHVLQIMGSYPRETRKTRN